MKLKYDSKQFFIAYNLLIGLFVQACSPTTIQKDADQIAGSAQYKLGMGYYGSEDYKKAFECFQEAAAHENEQALFMLGEMHYYGEYAEKDYKKAAEYYKQAKNNPGALYTLSEMHEEGDGVEQNNKKASAYRKQAADLGNVEAQAKLGIRAYKAGDYKHAIEYLEKAAIQEDLDSQVHLGNVYYHGISSIGLKLNYKLAKKWYKKAAKRGDIVAQFMLAGIYDKGGHGVEPTPGLALQWFKESAKNGYPDAQFMLGLTYYKQGAYDAALECFQKAANQGDLEAQSMVEKVNKALEKQRENTIFLSSY